MRSPGEPIGYDARRSGIRLNVDCSDRALDRLEARLERIDHETGRPTALIGHSRGAHFAKALAHRRPELVSQAISLGAGLDTPFDISVPNEGCGGRRRRRAPAHHRPGDPQRLPDRHLWLPLRARLRRPLPRERAADLDLLARRRGLVGGVPRPLRALRRDHRQLRGGWPSTARPTARSPRRSRAPAPQWKAPRRPLPSRPATLCGVGYIATGSATSSGWSAISGP